MKFLKMILASALGYILAVVVIGIMVVSIIAGLASTSKPKVVINDQSVLRLELNYPITDRVNDEGPLAVLAELDPNNPAPVGLNDILNSIESAKDDDKISGIILDLTTLQSGYAKLMEVRTKLEEFKESGKFIYAYSNMYDYQMYYLASVADSVFVNPEGQMLFNGLRAEVTMFANMMEKIGVEMQVIRHGKFKGAVEPYVRETLSEENRLQISEFIHSIYNSTLAEISESRGMSVEHLKQDANDLSMTHVSNFVSKGYLDDRIYRDEFYSIIKERMGLEDEDNIYFVSLKKYKKIADDHEYSADKVAVLYAAGSIVTGKGDGTQIASKDLSKTLKKLRENDKVKAVVFRVDSRGGSALASDIIWREAMLLADEKPLIVSMGDVAASGGYYISTPAHTIVAEPTTITGSIGVFGLVPNAEELLNDKLGVNMEYVGTNDYSDLGRIDRPLKEEEYKYIQNIIENIYSVFLKRVSDGRGMSVEEVGQIAEGRVWTGTMAKDIGLVDTLGGLEVAIALAVEAAELEEYQIKEYPKFSDPFEKLFDNLNTQTVLETQLGQTDFGKYMKTIIAASELGTSHSVQMFMPYNINVSSYQLR